MGSDPAATAFSDAEAVARYAEGPPRIVPGFADLHRMTTLLLAERVSERARVLVLGAGGGMERKTFATAHTGWTFDGVDPAPEMLNLAKHFLGPLAARVRWRQGYIDDAPAGPFDAATCLLTFHFVAPDERLRTTVEIHRRLRTGAPFVVAHMSIPQDEGARAIWLSRYAAFAFDPQIAAEKAQAARAAVDAHLHLLTPEQDEALLREAGFSNVSLFYAGFTFRGWVAYA
jgi:tRNA (cmo5U34)-methyltransferase